MTYKEADFITEDIRSNNLQSVFMAKTHLSMLDSFIVQIDQFYENEHTNGLNSVIDLVASGHARIVSSDYAHTGSCTKLFTKESERTYSFEYLKFNFCGD